jgi:hypothetical protein
MEVTMRKVLLIVVSLFLMAVAGRIPAHAQVVDTIEADIPFSFTVRDTTLPAGRYTVERVYTIDPNVMENRSSDAHSTAFVIVENAEIAKAPESAELIFDRVGDQYFLWEIFEGGSNTGVALPKSHAERELEEGGAMIQVVAVPVVINAAK